MTDNKIHAVNATDCIDALRYKHTHTQAVVTHVERKEHLWNFHLKGEQAAGRLRTSKGESKLLLYIYRERGPGPVPFPMRHAPLPPQCN